MAWWVLTAAVLLAVWGFTAKRRIDQSEKVREFRSDFFQAAGVLVDDVRTPESVIALVRFLASHIANWKAPWVVLFYLLGGRMLRTARRPSKEAKQLIHDIASLPEPLKSQAAMAMAAFALAITFNSIQIGWLIRRLALFGIRKRNSKDYDGGDDAETIVLGFADKKVSAACGAV